MHKLAHINSQADSVEKQEFDRLKLEKERACLLAKSTLLVETAKHMVQARANQTLLVKVCFAAHGGVFSIGAMRGSCRSSTYARPPSDWPIPIALGQQGLHARHPTPSHHEGTDDDSPADPGVRHCGPEALGRRKCGSGSGSATVRGAHTAAGARPPGKHATI
jgi:hypothetical protein